MLTISETENELRKLHSILSSKKRHVYVVGITVLWELFKREFWITKKEYLDSLAIRLELNSFDYDPAEPDEIIDAIVGKEEQKPVVQNETNYRQQARSVYYRLLRTGYFNTGIDNVDGKPVEILFLSEQAASLIQYVTEIELRKKRERESLCVYPSYSTLKIAWEEYHKAKDDLSKKVVKDRIAQNLYQALITAYERGEDLKIKIKKASNSFRFLHEDIARVTEGSELLLLCNKTYREELFENIMQPLRIEDSYEAYSEQIIRILDTWENDQTIISLLCHGAAQAGAERCSQNALLSEIISIRYIYASEVRQAWNFITEQERLTTELINKKARVILGQSSSIEHMLQTILFRLSSPDHVIQEICVNALAECLNLPSNAVFYDRDIAKVKQTYTIEKSDEVTIDEPFELSEDKSSYTTKTNYLTEAAENMNRYVIQHGGKVTNDEIPLQTKQDRVDQMEYILASRLKESKYAVPPIDDEKRIEKQGGNVPLVNYVGKED